MSSRTLRGVSLYGSAVEVLSSRVLLSPIDFDAAVEWYRDVLGLRIAREYGIHGRVTGTVFFLGGGFLELNRTHPARHRDPMPMTLWLQVPDVDAEHERLRSTGSVLITQAPETMPWGLREMWIEDPEGTRLVLVEVPPGHPLRTRLDLADAPGDRPADR
jgi:predicted enzyme related to lactoylglutathione lyase